MSWDNMIAEKQIVTIIRSAAILKNEYEAGTIINIANYTQVGLEIIFTIGSLTSCTIKVEFSDDKIN